MVVGGGGEAVGNGSCAAPDYLRDGRKRGQTEEEEEVLSRRDDQTSVGDVQKKR